MFVWYIGNAHLCNHIYISFLHLEVSGMINVSFVFLITVRKIDLKQNIDEETSWLFYKYYKLKKYSCNKKVSLEKLISLNNTKLCRKILHGGKQDKKVHGKKANNSINCRQATPKVWIIIAYYMPKSSLFFYSAL